MTSSSRQSPVAAVVAPTAAAGLAVGSISKVYPGTVALDDVTFSVPAGRIHALLGGNGSGKSTLVKVLAGLERAEPGGRVEAGAQEIEADRVTPQWALAAGLAFVHQDLGLFESLSVAENLFAGHPLPRRLGRVDWGALRRAAAADLEHFGVAVSPSAPMRDLRPVDRTLVAVARALRASESGDARVLVLDEPSARLPHAEVEFIHKSLREYALRGVTVVYVSHRLDEVLDVADGVTVLRDGRHVETRSTEGLDESTLAALIAGRSVDTGRPSMDASPALGRSVALRVTGLVSGRVRGVDLEIREGEIVGVAGLVGSGRTSLLEGIAGARTRTAGTVTVDDRQVPPGDLRAAIALGLAYVPEDRAADAIFPNLPIAENVAAPRARRYMRALLYRHGEARRDARAAMGRFEIVAPGVDALISQLSGGNQQKTVLARWLGIKSRVLLLDEPTQGVDVHARAQIHRHIRAAVAAGASALVVSSDPRELLALSDRIVGVADGRVTYEAPTAELDKHTLTEYMFANGRSGGAAR